MVTLYGAKGSGSAAIEVALEWAGAPWTLVQGATWEPGPGYEALKQTNPLGQVPTLVLPDGTAISESAAILIHLGLAHPASGLLPADAAARARCLRGLEAKQRQAIALAFFDGLSHGELAQHLRQPLGTVKTWVRRGLARLRSCLETQ